MSTNKINVKCKKRYQNILNGNRMKKCKMWTKLKGLKCKQMKNKEV